MAKGGRRYPLVIYTHMVNRWWPAVLVLGFALLGLAWAVYSWGFEQWRWLALASVGGLNVFLGLLLLVFRKSAYVQPFSDHLRLATPFLRLNISYKRIRRSSPSTMGGLFPPKSVSKSQAEIIEPLARLTAIVIELNALPMSRTALRFFLSPLFFKDKSPHLVILVNDWMRLSAELESMRSGKAADPSQRKRDSSILSRLPRK
ncbi:MAG: hypothetical protein C4557_05845 [Anaerolineaceae bacterium]|jgi:hypothetical protein|nr:MAG: hypothetical protein C4557_05845 [Anaerolineaceae bacterium]